MVLFCPPRKLALERQNYLDILDKQIKELEKMPLIDDMNIEVVLTLGLESTFACPKSN
jgi:hypothetical protein